MIYIKYTNEKISENMDTVYENKNLKIEDNFSERNGSTVCELVCQLKSVSPLKRSQLFGV